MSDRRRTRRWPRQLEVRFWKQGEGGQGTRAISTNVSRTGIFVRTQAVLPSGSRIRLALGHSGRDFTIEGIVMRALRTPAHLQSAMPSGMGVRFLSADELLEDLLPAIDFRAEERVPGSPETPTRGVSGLSADNVVRPGARLVEPDRPAPRLTPPSGPLQVPTSTPPMTPPESQRPAEPVAPLQVYPLHFRDSEQFRRVFDRDVKTGGLFINTSNPPALDAIIQVEVSVEGLGVPPIPLQARVVHRLEPPSGSSPGNLLAGMGVQFLDVGRAVERLRALLR
jgi:hypothetical protein